MLELIFGGARSGKSRLAERLAAGCGLAVTYIATSQALDGEMSARIQHHRQRRPSDWGLVEEPLELARALRDNAERIRRHELEHAMKMLKRGDDPAQVLEAMSRGLTNKIMHGPTQALNQAEGDERTRMCEQVSQLFNLHRGV